MTPASDVPALLFAAGSLVLLYLDDAISEYDYGDDDEDEDEDR